VVNKLVTAKVTLLVICVVQFGAASLNEAQSQNLVSLGSENRIVYVDINKLPTEIKSENKSISDLYDAKRTPGSFFETWTGLRDKCWAGSVLREGVIGYCLPYAKLGHHISDRDYQQVDRFISLGAFIDVYVWYEPAINRFYLCSRNLTDVLGPFVGNPNIVLKQSIKQRKGERHLRGVNLSLVTQRWMYPDEKEARMPRDEHYDCAHGHASGRAIEQVKLNTFITRFRLVNTSERGLYYLAEYSIADPVGYRFIKSAKRTDSDRAVSRYYAYEQRSSLRWIRLPPHSSVEFEVSEIGWQAKEQIYAVTLNTEPTYWDEVEIQGEYTSLFRTFKSEPVLPRVK
jgi:hypothetical protein